MVHAVILRYFSAYLEAYLLLHYTENIESNELALRSHVNDVHAYVWRHERIPKKKKSGLQSWNARNLRREAGSTAEARMKLLHQPHSKHNRA